MTKTFHLSARAPVWAVSPELVQAQVLAESGEKFLHYSPKDVAEEEDIQWLWDLYFPAVTN